MTANDPGVGSASNPPASGGTAWSLWLWVGAGFLLLVIGWGVMFTVARQANVQSVPLAKQEAKP
ncbi:hypothetical protein Verru16b_00340 [Lacunisphaera limnophila]|uniref:Uncharacterized protein n=2 Tax=Lacunisphaera limnophila TaxID=1838286 RepID=A0A1I7PI41_9BACT|nr:hypothetical protein Verru16b_00340 [Lacunisphaera limnophila]